MEQFFDKLGAPILSVVILLKLIFDFLQNKKNNGTETNDNSHRILLEKINNITIVVDGIKDNIRTLFNKMDKSEEDLNRIRGKLGI